MMSWVHFMLYMTNWTIPNPIVIPNVVSAIECCTKTTSVNSTSYFYNRRSKDCIVNPVPPFHTTDNLTKASGFLYFLKDAPKCGLPPVIENAKLMNVSQSNDGVYTAYYYCPKVYHFMVKSTSTCTGTTWSDGVECIALASCNAVKTCNPGYTTDGEFWFYPSGLNHQRARIYCNDMNTANPNEYLTLLGENYAEFPPGKYIYNSGCTLDTSTNNHQGKTYYNKIRIYVENMTVEQTDYSFTFQDYDNPVPYGLAQACSFFGTHICPQRGNAVLNLTSTGLIISSTTEWVTRGYDPYLTMLERTDVVVVLTGDGNCGGAKSNGPIKLQLDSSYSPPLSSAIEPECKV